MEPINDNQGNAAKDAQTEQLAAVGAILGAAAIEAAKAAVLPPSARVAEAAVGAAITFGALELFNGAEAAAKAAGVGAGSGLAKAAKEVASTPKDVKDHIKKNPGTAIVEGLVSPPLIIIDAKLRKWFGN